MVSDESSEVFTDSKLGKSQSNRKGKTRGLTVNRKRQETGARGSAGRGPKPPRASRFTKGTWMGFNAFEGNAGLRDRFFFRRTFRSHETTIKIGKW